MTTDRETVNNETVRALMRLNSISQVGLAISLGMSQASVAGKLKGRIRWSADEIASLAKLCDVPMETFFQPVRLSYELTNIPGYLNLDDLAGPPPWLSAA